MKRRLFKFSAILLSLLVASTALLAACNPDTEPTTTPTPTTTSTTSTPTPTTTTTPPTSEPAKPTSGIPLSVTLDYVGFKNFPNEEVPADIYFVTVITDGYEQATQQILPNGSTFQFDIYQTVELNQEIFHTDSAGDSLKVCILAYQQNDPAWQTAILIPALEEIARGLTWNDYRSVEEIISTTANHMAKSDTEFTGGGDTLIGYFEDIWSSAESLGIGQYQSVGTDDLRLWFSIWSTEAPPTLAAPTLLPEAEIEEIDSVTTASVGQTRTDIVRIHNTETHPLTVTLKGTSLLAGEFYNQEVTLDAGGYAWVENDATNPYPGMDTITYEIYFRDTQVDTASESLRVIADKRLITLVEWRNSDGSERVDKNTLDGTPLTLYVEAPGYTGVVFTASIRSVEPDGSLHYEENLPINIINGAGKAEWKAEWQSVLEGDPTYVFGVKTLYSNELTVVKKYETPPAVSIDSVDIEPYVEADETHTDTINIKNDEDEIIIIRLKGNSADLGEFYNKAVSLPAGSTTSFSIPAVFSQAGIKSITYEIYFQGVPFDSWSGTFEVF